MLPRYRSAPLLLLAAVSFMVSLFPLYSRAAAPAYPEADYFEVVVLGGTPEGVAAAVAAAREGRRVLLAEPGGSLGGIMTRGGLNTVDLNRGPDWQLLNGGLFEEWYRRVEGDSFDVSTASRAFAALVGAERNITLWLNTGIGRPVVTDGQVRAVTLLTDRGPMPVRALRFIDATADAEVAAVAGVGFTVGRSDYVGRVQGQAVTLVFRLTGVNWGRAAAYLEADGDPASGSSARSLWGYSEIMYGYTSREPRVGVRGLNVGRQNDGSVLINALWVFGVNALDNGSLAEARRLAEAELPRLAEYIRRNCPGFEGAQLAGTADDLYVRESRHMSDALYQLTIDDVLENRDQPDAVAYGSYPVDIQAAVPGERVRIVGVPRRYAVPLRSLIPARHGNLAVASRSAGYTSLAHGSARTVPVGMAAAQAAGVAAAVSLEEGVSLPALALRPDLVARVQERLRAQGVRLAPFSEPSPLDGSPFAEHVRFFRRRGLVEAGYTNNYRLEEPVTGQELNQFLLEVGAAFGLSLAVPAVEPGTPLTLSEGVTWLYAARRAVPGDPVAEALRAGAVEPGWEPEALLTRGQLYQAARRILMPGVAE